MEENKKSGSPDGLSWESFAILEMQAADKEKKEAQNPIKADGIDRIFAVVFFIVGYQFINMFTVYHYESAFAWFTVFYVAAVLVYACLKKIHPAAESWFWLAVVCSVGICYQFWTIMPFLQFLAWIVFAAYWTYMVGGRLLDNGKSSQWILCDLWNTLFVVPFCNFGCEIRVLFAKIRPEEKEEKRELASSTKAILLGIVLVIPMLMIIVPLLSRADDAFGKLFTAPFTWLSDHIVMSPGTLCKLLFAIPVALYLYGLCFGMISGRNTQRIKKEGVREAGESMRMLPNLAMATAVSVISFLYVLFVALQSRYLFSAFLGIRPEEYTFAEYARKGFFELCTVAVVNLIILLFVNLFVKRREAESRIIRWCNVVLSALTLLLIVTAMSKMLLYIGAYGLTEKRILTMTFMTWLFLVFAAWIVYQWRRFALFRFCILSGAVLFALLCVLPVGKGITWWNLRFAANVIS